MQNLVAEQEHPDLILLNVMMPDLDGFEVCRRLKADSATADIPVVFVSAHDEASCVAKGFDAGGVDYVMKPIKREELLSRVKTHLERVFLARALEEKKRDT